MTEHVATVRVRYGETDRQGVVYHGHFFSYFEVARTECLRARGLAYRDMEARGFFLVVTEASCRYRADAGYDDVLEIATRVTRASRVRVSFSYVVRRAGDARTVAEGETTLACVDAEGKPQRLPPDAMARFQEKNG